jgi:hypothetical protein
MRDAVTVRAMMRWSLASSLLMLVAGSCGSVAPTGSDGGGGSAGTGTGGDGNGGSGGTAGSPGGRGGGGGGGGTGGCAANQVWCPGCEPGTGTCYTGGCPGVACPPIDGGGGGTNGGTGGTGGAAACGARACTSSELCVHPSCGGTAPICNPLPDGGQCPTGWTFRNICNTSPTPGPGCEAPPCTPPAPFCLTRPASCGATPTCACLPANVCNGSGACGFVSGGDVGCLSA